MQWKLSGENSLCGAPKHPGEVADADTKSTAKITACMLSIEAFLCEVVTSATPVGGKLQAKNTRTDRKERESVPAYVA